MRTTPVLLQERPGGGDRRGGAGRAWKSTDVRYRVTDKRKAAVGSGGYKAQKG